MFLNLTVPDDAPSVSKENIIRARKWIQKGQANVRKSIKSKTCLYCGKEVTSFCNSHSVPAFCLRSIAWDGKIYNPNHLLKLPAMDEDAGVKNSGTFQIICRECDSTIFQDYESEKSFDAQPAGLILSSIVLKNYLARIASVRFTQEEFRYLIRYVFQKSAPGDEEAVRWFKEQLPKIPFWMAKIRAGERDLEDYTNGFKIAKRAKERKWDNEYYLFYFQKLPYTVPVAFQLCFPLILDLDNQVINNIYDYSARITEKDLHICIFPMSGKSVILAFTHRKDSSSYRRFFKQLKALPLDEQLSVILYMILLYSENVYFSKLLPENIFECSSIIKATQQNSDLLFETPDFDLREALNAGYSLSKHKDIPPLLSERYSMETLRAQTKKHEEQTTDE